MVEPYVSFEERMRRCRTPWIEAMPVKRARTMLYIAFLDGELPDLERSSVRAKGAAFWRNYYWCGKKTFAALACAVGGFDK